MGAIAKAAKRAEKKLERGLQLSQVEIKRLLAVEKENAELRQQLAEQVPKIEAYKRECRAIQEELNAKTDAYDKTCIQFADYIKRVQAVALQLQNIPANVGATPEENKARSPEGKTVLLSRGDLVSSLRKRGWSGAPRWTNAELSIRIHDEYIRSLLAGDEKLTDPILLQIANPENTKFEIVDRLNPTPNQE